MFHMPIESLQAANTKQNTKEDNHDQASNQDVRDPTDAGTAGRGVPKKWHLSAEF